jgi:glycosyltransferase involved in cell wall biosynthesis
MNILHIQYAGDFQEAYQRLITENGKENYYGQKYSVSAVVEQARRGNNTKVITLFTTDYDAQLEENLSAKGFKNIILDYDTLFEEIIRFNPSRVILKLPDPRILAFLRKKKFITLPVLADSFENVGLIRGRLRRFRIARELSHPSIHWIANHQINASKSLQRLGISPDKILPYDWEYPDNPKNWDKTIPNNICQKKINLFYAGMLIESKGIFDLIKALKVIQKKGRLAMLNIAGKGDGDVISKLAEYHGVCSSINLLGLIPHDEVLLHMHKADAVVVPSHHAYPEGLPMTIMESLMVHTPVIVSDHPMFVGRVGKLGAARFFREKNAEDLAQQVIELLSNYNTYKAASQNAPLEWAQLNLDLKWADIINSWIENPAAVDFKQYSLGAYLKQYP